jgi:hypothetical protein
VTNPTHLQPITAQSLVPPGHPLVVAHTIVVSYPSFAAATEKDGDGHAAAEGDERITGGASMIAEALNVLRLARNEAGFQEAADYARDRWFRNSGADADALAAGQRQADQIAPLLKQGLREWAW